MKKETKFGLSDENAFRIDLLTSVETEAFLKNKPFTEYVDRISAVEATEIFGFGKKPESFHNEELPVSFQKRTFIKNLAALPYKLEEIPGHIVKYDSEKEDYAIVSLSRYVKENQYPETTIIEDGLLFSSKINSEASFNGSFLIGGLAVNSKSIMELIIQDVLLSIIPDNLILKNELQEKAKDIPESDRKNYFFIRGTTLTLVNNRKFKEQKFDAKINVTYVTAEGKVYGNNEKFSKERLVSLDLVALDELLLF